MECLRFCTANQFYHCTHSRENENAADFLSHLEMVPKEKIILKIREDIPTTLIEVNFESTGIAQEEPVFFDTTDQEQTREKEL